MSYVRHTMLHVSLCHHSVFTSPNINLIVHDPVSFFSCQSDPDECLTDIEITEPIIIDYIPSYLLLNGAAELAPALKLLFSQSLAHGFIPASLKRAAITPIFKSGPKTSPSNYRPISLTSTIIEVFERIIRKQVVAFLTRQGHLNNTQHGFRSGRSCLSALLDVFDDLMHMLSILIFQRHLTWWIMAYFAQAQRFGYHW